MFALACLQCGTAVLTPTRAAHQQHAHTYAGGAYTGLTKVGWTEDLIGRFKRHTSCCQTKFDKQHFPEDALVQIHDAYGCERAIHKHLKCAGRWPGPVACHSNSGKTHNEWFTGTRATIVDVVKLYVREWRAAYGDVRRTGV
jgi:hypothetical protein